MKTYGQFRQAVRASGRVVIIFLPFFSLFLTAAAATVSLTLFSPFAFCRVVDRAEAQREAGGGSTRGWGNGPNAKPTISTVDIRVHQLLILN